jgi:hypothetical protein
MNVGMLWFDNDPRSALEVKVARAADYYRTKYGSRPTLCFVHPSMLPNAPQPTPAPEAPRVIAGGVELRSNRSVLPNHFWIGVR